MIMKVTGKIKCYLYFCSINDVANKATAQDTAIKKITIKVKLGRCYGYATRPI
jgi:hypothetical protein